jgi:RNA-splicing ligase RtcB
VNVKYFVDEDLIPDDGSKEIIRSFDKAIDPDNNLVYIYPDVHYKKGARLVNGMLICSDRYIYPACLGVDNCGFTFGTVKTDSIGQLRESFAAYAKLLKDYTAYEKYSYAYIDSLFREYLGRDFRANFEFYEYIGTDTLEKVYRRAGSIWHTMFRRTAKNSLCSLGGGNHFFEIQRIIEIYKASAAFQPDSFVFMLHSDSIATGNLINLTYSNLSELDNIQNPLRYLKSIIKHRIWQFLYFSKTLDLFYSPVGVFKLLFSKKDHRTIRADIRLGGNLLFAHNLASLFGEMNRRLIIENWRKSQKLDIQIIGSHSHDSIRIENGKIIQRNGVQRIGNDKYFMLPGALGACSYIMENTYNRQAFYSANHGMGRMQDKYIARDVYTEEETRKGIQADDITLYRVGGGNIAEQNKRAFKDAAPVIKCMRKFNLGVEIAKTKPVAVIKG